MKKTEYFENDIVSFIDWKKRIKKNIEYIAILPLCARGLCWVPSKIIFFFLKHELFLSLNSIFFNHNLLVECDKCKTTLLCICISIFTSDITINVVCNHYLSVFLYFSIHRNPPKTKVQSVMRRPSLVTQCWHWIIKCKHPIGCFHLILVPDWLFSPCGLIVHVWIFTATEKL